MSVDYIEGNLLNADTQYICHQVNCQGKMNSGIAKSIREKWPNVYDKYIEAFNYAKGLTLINISDYLLGSIDIVEVEKDKNVINMFAQEYYGYDGRRYTSYDAFWSCLGEIKTNIPKGSTIAFPDHIGCCRGGANWEVIRTMIEVVLGWDYKVYIYKLEE